MHHHHTLKYLACLLSCLLAASGGGSAFAQAPGTETQEDPVFRFTPEMARALAGQYTRKVLLSRYELDPTKADEVTENVARRLMATAHRVDKQGGEFMEYFMSEMIRGEAEGRNQAGIGPELGKGIAERITPMVPAIRDLLRDVSSDVRPMLSFKQQLKLTGDVAMAGTALNGFEQAMQRWKAGGAKPFENPFETEQNQQVAREADGTSKQAKAAQRSADQAVTVGDWRTWKDYIEQARKLYEFDTSQVAAAESLLREYTARAENVSRDATWRDRMYRNRLWSSMLLSLRQGWGNLLYSLLDAQQKELNDPVAQIAVEFKTRIDDIPTAAQRTAADARITAALAAKGLAITEPAP